MVDGALFITHHTSFDFTIVASYTQPQLQDRDVKTTSSLQVVS